jgi:hypothetical protein
MHQLKTKFFQRWQKKTTVTDAQLQLALFEMQAGLIDADLGGGVVKKRVATGGRGKSGGVRTLIATNKGGRWLFVFGFEKNERANITPTELEALQELANGFLGMSDAAIKAAIEDGTFIGLTT